MQVREEERERAELQIEKYDKEYNTDGRTEEQIKRGK
jgi:hypothetical protein